MPPEPDLEADPRRRAASFLFGVRDYCGLPVTMMMRLIMSQSQAENPDTTNPSRRVLLAGAPAVAAVALTAGAGEVLDRAYDADETLTDGTRRFIDRHITPGEKRSPAPSVRRESFHAAQKKQA